MLRRLFLITIGIAATKAHAQSSRTRIAVSHSGTDQVGNEFAFALRESIRNSSGYELVPEERARYFVSLSTLDPQADLSTNGNLTAAAITVTAKNPGPVSPRAPHTWYEVHLTSSVNVVGRDKVEVGARRALASIEAAIEKYRAAGNRS